jgi:hypothetical protein
MTKILLRNLEQILAEECEKIDELYLFASVSPHVYALLYIAARDGEIDIADALFAAKNCSRLMAFFLRNLLTIADIASARVAVEQIKSQPKLKASDYECYFLLLAWLARHEVLSNI